MEGIIDPIDKSLIKAELTPDKFLRPTNKAGNEIYVITHHNAPNTMQEIGRLRELSFRTAGGGTGKVVDIDSYDTQENPYKQLIVWDPDREDIIGGYRFQYGSQIPVVDGKLMIATATFFNFSDEFLSDFMPVTMELGRSFVQPIYQSSKAGAKALFALDNLWDGLGAVSVLHSELKYFFGKVTMYTDYPVEARDHILSFMHKFFPDNDKLIWAKEPLKIEIDPAVIDATYTADTFKENYKILNKTVRSLGANIPPLVSAYMGLTPTMRTFGTVNNHLFGGVEETGILVTVGDIFEDKRERHIDSFKYDCSKAHIVE